MTQKIEALIYTVELEPAEEGGFIVSVPALPGCHTCGDTYEHALIMAEDVITLWLATLEKNGEPIPQEPAPVGVSKSHVRINTPVRA